MNRIFFIIINIYLHFKLCEIFRANSKNWPVVALHRMGLDF